MLASCFVGLKICFQKIGEKEYFQNSKHDKKFDENDNPNLFAPVIQVFKSADIELQNPDEYVLFVLHKLLCHFLFGSVIQQISHFKTYYMKQMFI